MLTYNLEDISIFDEVVPLALEHIRSIAYALVPEEPEINPVIYKMMAYSGAMRIFTVRDEKKLAGYAIFFIGHSPNWKGLKQANEQGLFILPEYRRPRTAINFLRFCDNHLKSEGVSMVSYQSPADAPFGGLLSRLGYSKVDEIYARRL